MNRLYAIETDLTITGTNADHRLALKPSAIETFSRALASNWAYHRSRKTGRHSGQVEAVANDLKARPKGSTVVLVRQPAAVSAIRATPSTLYLATRERRLSTPTPLCRT
jgi:molybdopterin-containing oxidoreductase family iron-sulfur binding subunit